MSMWLNVAVLSETGFKKLEKQSELLDGLFFSEDEAGEQAALDSLGMKEADVGGCDYLSVSAAGEAMAELDGEEADEPDFGASGELDFEAGYDSAFFIAPKNAKALSNETWTLVAELDEELKAMLARAKKQKLYVVAVVS